jgi:hypothetical protein
MGMSRMTVTRNGLSAKRGCMDRSEGLTQSDHPQSNTIFHQIWVWDVFDDRNVAISGEAGGVQGQDKGQERRGNTNGTQLSCLGNLP